MAECLDQNPRARPSAREIFERLSEVPAADAWAARPAGPPAPPVPSASPLVPPADPAVPQSPCALAERSAPACGGVPGSGSHSASPNPGARAGGDGDAPVCSSPSAAGARSVARDSSNSTSAAADGGGGGGGIDGGGAGTAAGGYTGGGAAHAAARALAPGLPCGGAAPSSPYSPFSATSSLSGTPSAARPGARPLRRPMPVVSAFSAEGLALAPAARDTPVSRMSSPLA